MRTPDKSMARGLEVLHGTTAIVTKSLGYSMGKLRRDDHHDLPYRTIEIGIRDFMHSTCLDFLRDDDGAILDGEIAW